MAYQFPKNFWWGTATASHQVEGGNVYNDTWLMEHTPGTAFVESSGDAVDHYHRYAEDITLLAELGFNMYRFSLEWSRIEPEEGEFSFSELEHYRRMLAACHEHGITPMVTYHHFSSPRWLMRYGGWSGAKTPELFARFCERAARHLGDLTGAACTLNEINIATLISVMSMFRPAHAEQPPAWMAAAARALDVSPQQFVPFMFATGPKSIETVQSAHRRGVEALKSGPGSYPVGVTLALMEIQAGPGGEETAARVRYDVNESYLEAARGDDFVGVQTYSRFRFGPQGMLPPEMEVTQMGYEFYPEALEATIRQAARVAGVPVIVTENGVAGDDDSRRVEFIQRAVKCVAKCLKDGIDVRGYTYWSAFDNFEWMQGYKMKFGLIAVDRQTQVRTVKPSARWLGALARSGIF
ncbi:MAG: family 1 glycosylhydrolase [Anaerolineaceae bacterium]|jgi:beta-glucosidase